MKRLFSILLLLLLVACGSDTTEDFSDATGVLYVVDQNDQGIDRIDLATNETERFFQTPPLGWVYELDISPDGNQIVLAYSAPPEPGGAIFDHSGIYLLDIDNPTEPELLFGDNTSLVFYFNPMWSNDGRYIYAVLSARTGTGEDALQTTSLLRYDMETEMVVEIAENALWPRVSADNSRITWVDFDPQTGERGLSVADINGDNREVIFEIGSFSDIDSPLFSVDGSCLFFVVAPELEEARRWQDVLMGVRVAEAHNENVPSAWWKLCDGMDSAERIQPDEEIIIYGSFDASGERLFYATFSGVFQIDADGTNITRLAEKDGYRNIDWAPR